MLRVNKSSLRGRLARVYFQNQRRAAPQQALADALLVIEGIAQEAEPSDLYLRAARYDSALWLDLGDHTGRAIRISRDGWAVESEAPVFFKRTALTGALPGPIRNGTLDDLWRHLNVAVSDRALVAAWLIAALIGDIPHPVLSFFGEQGTGKTTAQKMLVGAIDPGPVPLRKSPRDAEPWVTAAAGSWIVGLDNMSDIPAWLSDSICRGVTGEGDVRRRLYTDGEHTVFAYRRCVCLNSIDLGATRGDLAERMLPINLAVIPEDKRMGEEEIWPAWREAHPKVLGAILDLAAATHATLPSVEPKPKPRMADFARVLAAVDKVLGTNGLPVYLARQNALATDSLSGDPFIAAIESLGRFEGTSAELLTRVTTPERPPRGWPADARAATQLLRRQAAVMRKAGWHVEDDGGRSKRNVAVWTIIPPEMVRNPASLASPSSRNGPNGETARQAKQECRPSLDDEEAASNGQALCQQCSEGGELMEVWCGSATAQLHRACIDEWTAWQTEG